MTTKQAFKGLKIGELDVQRRIAYYDLVEDDCNDENKTITKMLNLTLALLRQLSRDGEKRVIVMVKSGERARDLSEKLRKNGLDDALPYCRSTRKSGGTVSRDPKTRRILSDEKWRVKVATDVVTSISRLQVGVVVEWGISCSGIKFEADRFRIVKPGGKLITLLPRSDSSSAGAAHALANFHSVCDKLGLSRDVEEINVEGILVE